MPVTLFVHCALGTLIPNSWLYDAIAKIVTRAGLLSCTATATAIALLLPHCYCMYCSRTKRKVQWQGKEAKDEGGECASTQRRGGMQAAARGRGDGEQDRSPLKGRLCRGTIQTDHRRQSHPLHLPLFAVSALYSAIACPTWRHMVVNHMQLPPSHKPLAASTPNSSTLLWRHNMTIMWIYSALYIVVPSLLSYRYRIIINFVQNKTNDQRYYFPDTLFYYYDISS